MNSFWIKLDGFSCQTKINFTEQGPLTTSEMEPFETIIDSWKLLTSVANSLDVPCLNYDFQRTEEGCSNVNSLVVLWMVGDPSSILLLTKNEITIPVKPF